MLAGWMHAVCAHGREDSCAHAFVHKQNLEQGLTRRYVLWLLGDVDAVRDSAAPLAEQLCQVSHEQADVAAIHWTQRADGLLCADTGGHVTMYEALTTGLVTALPHDTHIVQAFLDSHFAVTGPRPHNTTEHV